MSMEEKRVTHIKVFLDDIYIIGSLVTTIVYSHRKMRESDVMNRENERFLTVINCEIFEYANPRSLGKEKVLFINKDRIKYIKPISEVNYEE